MSRMGKLHIFLVLEVLFIYSVSASPKVVIEQGLLKGKVIHTRAGREIFGFLGIPYAAPPTGQLRFKSPQPPLPWEGERDATKDGSSCLQQFVLIEKLRNTVVGNEDCLYLNVFTPKVSKSAKLPVMFFIHGGGFAGGSGAMIEYGPELLLDRDVVLVAINYRLGALGFLSTGDTLLPGNYGLKDQNAALRWVQNNIEHFGGDKNSVTIFGESAGSGSVHLQMLSPRGKGLFHAAVSHSGTALSPWAFSSRDRHRKLAAQLAKFVNCPAQPTNIFLDCLMKLPAEQIVGTMQNFIEWDMDPVVTFNPALEPEEVEDAFLTQDPWTLTSDVPWMVGFNENEGGLKVASMTQGDVEGKFKVLNERFGYILPMFLFYENTAEDPAIVTEAIRKFYFKNADKITLEHVPDLIKLHTDSYFMGPSLEGARRHSGPVFVYYFAYNMSTSFSLCNHYFNNPNFVGVCHFDELMYLFPMEGFAPKFIESDPDYKVSKNMVQIWTNFARNRMPRLDDQDLWKSEKGSSEKYILISKDGVSIQKNLLTERDKFWRNLSFRSKPFVNKIHKDEL